MGFGGFIALQLPHFVLFRADSALLVALAKLPDKDTVSIILRVVGISWLSDQWKFSSDVEALTQCDCYTGLNADSPRNH